MKRVTRREGRVEGNRGGGGGRGGEGSMVYNQTQGRLDRKRDSREESASVPGQAFHDSALPRRCSTLAFGYILDSSSNLCTSAFSDPPPRLTNGDIDIELSQVEK